MEINVIIVHHLLNCLIEKGVLKQSYSNIKIINMSFPLFFFGLSSDACAFLQIHPTQSLDLIEVCGGDCIDFNHYWIIL